MEKSQLMERPSRRHVLTVSSRSRAIGASCPCALRASGPDAIRGLAVSRPRGALEALGLRASCPHSLVASGSRALGPHASGSCALVVPSGPHASRPCALASSRPRALVASSPRALASSWPRALMASSPRGALATSRPRALEPSRCRILVASSPRDFGASCLAPSWHCALVALGPRGALVEPSHLQSIGRLAQHPSASPPLRATSHGPSSAT